MITGPLWLIGCGNMAGAMLSRWLATGLDPATVTVVDPRLPDMPVRVVASCPEEPPPDMIMLGVKPQMLGAVVPSMRNASVRALMISVLAGTTVSTLSAHFPAARGVLRVMPNLPVATGHGVVALHGELRATDRIAIDALMDPLGLVEWIADEALFDAITALGGSGPAFVYRFIDALARGAEVLGLPGDQAARLALAMVEGAALTAAAAAVTPAELADRVASKGGSTRAGLDIMDADGAFDRLVAATLFAACRRNAELAAITAAD